MGEILFLSHRIPWPPDRGDKIRSHHILRRLARMAPVHVATFAEGEEDAAWEVELAMTARSYCLARRTVSLPMAGLAALAQGKPISLTAFRHAALSRYVARTLADRPISAIYVFSGQMGQYVPPDYAGRVVMDFVDVDSAKFDAYGLEACWPVSWLHRREGRLLRAEEARLAARAEASVLISADEATLFAGRLPPAERASANVRVLGNGIDTELFDPLAVDPEPRIRQAGGPRMIFTGQMDYPPNAAAAIRAVTRVMPLVRTQLPDATFHVVGRKPTAQVRALHGVNGCHVWGEVEDVRPWLRGADMALIPLSLARGVQNKVLEAMAMALPVVATPEAATGIAAVNGRHIAITPTDTEIAAAVIRLSQQPEHSRIKGLAARHFVEDAHNWQAVLAPLSGMVMDGPHQGPAEAGRDPGKQDPAADAPPMLRLHG